ncbi:MAG: pullulanase [Paenibacillaceae bacterium]|nr:pullulanase [Paenibacillaceae bacterium]
MAVQKEIDYQIEYGDPAVVGGLSVFSREFDDAYFYEGGDLGAHYTPEATSFSLWAPTSSEALVVLYSSWDGGPEREILMTRGDKGVWNTVIPGNLEGMLYTYRVLVSDQWNEAVDPYAKAVSINGDKGALIDLSKTNPHRWTNDRPPFDHPLDSIIYEVHIRDLSIHPLSGITHKGKYLGACEPGTTGPEGIATGLSHIRSLGVTHVQLLPVYDYATESVDETNPDECYNWGYDPKNYNAPEGSYSLNPYDPGTRILELKTLIQTLHDNGLRVIMDVVYNHVYDGYRIHFTKLVPGYYLRYKNNGRFSNGSGCGNDTASERRMMRRFIVESVLYWAQEYHLDGFRFDLMGLLDVETMNEIRRRLDELDPTIVTLGEGWVMQTELPESMRANQINAGELPGIGHFNDHLRDALKGSLFNSHASGFAGGEHGLERQIERGIAAAVAYNYEIRGFALEPVQTVSYVEAHDNHTLWDKLLLSNPQENDEIRRQRHMLASAVVLTSQGIAFLHAGQEFMRTKEGHDNSYRSPDPVNWLDWQLCARNQNSVLYMKKLIALRKAHPAFRMRTAGQIRNHLVFEQAPGGSVAFTLRDHANNDDCKHIFVVHNANPYPITLNLPLPGAWTVILGLGQCGSFDRINGGPIEIFGLSSVVLGVYEHMQAYPV